MRKMMLSSINYMEEQGCDAVVLACTELPLFVEQADTSMPLFMSTHILVQALLEECFAY